MPWAVPGRALGMRVHLDLERCQGHGRCYVLAPAVYEPDDDGRGLVVSATVSQALEDPARLGADNCPEDAISLTDERSEHQIAGGSSG